MENNVVLFFVSNCWLARKTFACNGKTENLAEQHDVPVVDSSLVLVGGAQVVKWAWKFLSIDSVVGKQDSKCEREWPKPTRSEKKKAKSCKKNWSVHSPIIYFCAPTVVVSFAIVFRFVTQRCVTSLKTTAKETRTVVASPADTGTRDAPLRMSDGGS